METVVLGSNMETLVVGSNMETVVLGSNMETVVLGSNMETAVPGSNMETVAPGIATWKPWRWRYQLALLKQGYQLQLAPWKQWYLEATKKYW